MKRCMLSWIFCSGLSLLCLARAGAVDVATPAQITKSRFGLAPGGKFADLYTLVNKHGAVMKVTNYGCTLVALEMPDKNGVLGDIVLGYDTLEDYIAASPYFGCVAGRYANRIANGHFSIGPFTYVLATNNAPAGRPCSLHGGELGFDKVVWDAEGLMAADRVGVKFHRISPSYEEGFPGNLDVTVHYWLTDKNEFRVEYAATTDMATPVNLTHHSYFNLEGHDRGSILDHALMIDADHITAVDEGLIPTGELMDVSHTPFDFRAMRIIGQSVDAAHEQIQFGQGYDHNFVLNHHDGTLRLVARAEALHSGRTMEVLTTEPGLQFYCGNFLDASNIGKGGFPYARRSGFCLEAQHFPDSPNQPDFPSTILHPKAVYEQVTVYRFSVRP